MVLAGLYRLITADKRIPGETGRMTPLNLVEISLLPVTNSGRFNAVKCKEHPRLNAPERSQTKGQHQ